MRRRTQILVASITMLMVVVAGPASAALLSGDDAFDTLAGTKRADVISGRSGGDLLYGRSGDDLLYGGGGGDYLSGDGGRDVLYGGSGGDQIYADDGARDIVFCGSGTDTVFADRLDFVSGCEIKGPVALKGGVLATFAVGHERFQVWVTDEKTIWNLYQLRMDESTARIPSGRILKGPGRGGHNAPYSWQLSPKDIAMADFTAEYCDAEPSFVEENVGYFTNKVGRYCPWQARLVKLRNYTGTKIEPPKEEEVPPPSIIFPETR